MHRFAPGRGHPMGRRDPSALSLDLEVHLVGRDRRIGGFVGQLPTLRR